MLMTRSYINMSFRPCDSLSEIEAVTALENCIIDVRAQMKEDMLWLNYEKTEFLLVCSRQQLAKVSKNSITVGEANVTPVSSARNLGAWLDSHLDMSTHTSKTSASACYYLYNIRHIRKFLSSFKMNSRFLNLCLFSDLLKMASVGEFPWT